MGHHAVSFEPMEARRLFAASLVSDAAGLGPSESVTIDGTSYFFADNGVTGRELWKSDGTAVGTVLVKDLTPGATGTKLHSIYQAGGRAVFVTQANERVDNGRIIADYTVWSSDGTAGGTFVLITLQGVGWPTFREAGARLAFAVRPPNGASGHDALLYFTDGTAAGTKLVKEFRAQGDTHYWIPKLFATGDRVVFTPDEATLWASDGTSAGTIELTATIGGLSGFVSSSNMAEAGGKVVVPGDRGRLMVTDGTVGGTSVYDAELSHLEGQTNAVAGGFYYFVEVKSVENVIRKAIYAMDVADGSLTAVYATTGEGSDNHFTLMAMGEEVLFIDTEVGDQTGAVWSTDGTAAGTTKVVDLPRGAWILSPVAIDGTMYFGMISDAFDEDAEGERAAFVGSRISGPGIGGVGVNTDDYKLELWRSDGTAAGTGVVRALFAGPIDGKQVLITLTAALGKLAIRTEVATGIEPGEPWSSNSLTKVSDETVVYDPAELSFGREGATARLVNGVLRIGGSLADDRIRLWHSVRMPDKLVVEYNGNFRSFPIALVSKIIVDLQAGNDYVEFLEEEGGALRMRTSILGGDGTDTIITGTGRDTIIGGNGGDYIRSRGNADMIIGGGGRDRINAGQGDDVIAGGTGNDSIVGGEGSDVLFGQLAIERAFGTVWESLEDLEDDVVLLPP